jgi:hypothetical protein
MSDIKEGRGNIVPCTLYSGHYHFGVGALANSLYRNGFRGRMCVGYEPPLPPWAASTRRLGDKVVLEVEPAFTIEFIPWPSRGNLSLEKARFLLHVLDEVASDSLGVMHFDADLVVKASWAFFERWLEQGVALCLDACYPLVPALHPWRREWRELAAAEGNVYRNLDYYANSGFVGVPRRHREFARCWAALIDRYVSQNSRMPNQVKFNPRERAFTGDQDMLNAAMMATDVPLSIIGQDAMDFTPGGFLMSHALDEPKPWQRRFLLSALSGRPPAIAEKAYWQYADFPIRLFTPLRTALTRAALRTASAIGRFYARR